MSLIASKPVLRVSEPGDTNRAVQLQMRLEISCFGREEFYFLYRENKGAEQLRSFCAADLQLCFRICKYLVFSRPSSYIYFVNK